MVAEHRRALLRAAAAHLLACPAHLLACLASRDPVANQAAFQAAAVGVAGLV